MKQILGKQDHTLKKKSNNREYTSESINIYQNWTIFFWRIQLDNFQNVACTFLFIMRSTRFFYMNFNPDFSIRHFLYQNNGPFPCCCLSRFRSEFRWSMSLICMRVCNSYTLFQNGRHFGILLFPCKLALLASYKVKYSFEFYV